MRTKKPVDLPEKIRLSQKTDVLSIADVASLSGKSQKTIRRAIHAQKLKAKKLQNHYLIQKTDFEEWKNNGYKEDDFVNTEFISKKDEVNWADISDLWSRNGWKHTEDRNGLTFIDLFSGAGGLSCGLVEAGWTPLASVEILPQAVETYKFNFDEKKKFKDHVVTGDIRKKDVKQELYDSVKDKKVDLIVGGYPCQGFSLAGYRVVADPRNSLYLEMLKTVDHLKPEFIVMENVEGLRSMLNGKIEEKIISDYKKIGYNINVTILNSADYGVPQIRHRVIFIGNRVGKTNYHPKPLLTPDKYVSLGKAISKYMNWPENPQKNHVFSHHSPQMVERFKKLKEGESLYGNYSDAWKKSPWDKPSCTIKENHGGVNIHPKLNRTLTARELAALQSFPDDFIFKGTKRWQLVQIGNAVPPLLGKAVGLAVEKSIQSFPTPSKKQRKSKKGKQSNKNTI